jgi:hypothetical protein
LIDTAEAPIDKLLASGTGVSLNCCEESPVLEKAARRYAGRAERLGGRDMPRIIGWMLAFASSIAFANDGIDRPGNQFSRALTNALPVSVVDATGTFVGRFVTIGHESAETFAVMFAVVPVSGGWYANVPVSLATLDVTTLRFRGGSLYFDSADCTGPPILVPLQHHVLPGFAPAVPIATAADSSLPDYLYIANPRAMQPPRPHRFGSQYNARQCSPVTEDVYQWVFSVAEVRYIGGLKLPLRIR